MPDKVAQLSTEGSHGLGKLLPKAIAAKRRRRRQRQAEGDSAASLRGSDGTNSSAGLDEDDDGHSENGDNRSIGGRSFGSFESGPEPDAGAQPQRGTSRSRRKSQSPSRPAPPSAHPSLIGYLTTSSPVVQATHIEPQSQPSASPQPPSRSSRSKSRGNTITSEPDLALLQTSISAKAAPLDKRLRASRVADDRPSTSPGAENAPFIVNTPPTPTDQDTPSAPDEDPGSGTDGQSSARNMSTHKRSTSASAAIGPSKSSSFTPSSLSRSTEGSEGASDSNAGTSFLSSMFSAAQNAATNLSANIQNTGISIGANKVRSSPLKQPPPLPRVPSESEVQVEPAAEAAQNTAMEQKESAVRTLGAGDLSLSQLGFAEAPPAASPLSAKFTDSSDTRARSESAPADTHGSQGEIHPEESASRPRSLINEASSAGTRTPPQMDFDDKIGGVQRTPSHRSSSKTHRPRGSSVTTVGVPITAVTSPVVQPSATFTAPKLTGFAIASKKRNRDFHTIFKSVPDDDYLIEDYSCALQREILAHGRLYVSEGHICFSSNILGWTTTLVMSFDEIVSVEKRSTALLFKNGLMISTLHAKHIFASFTSRDATYDLIVNIWKLGHPTLTSTLNGVRLEGTGGDKTEKLDAEPAAVDPEEQAGSESDEESEEDGEEFYEEDEHESPPNGRPAEPAVVEGEADKAVTRKVSAMTTNGAAPVLAKDAAPPAGAADFPGPATHAPTECGDASTHFDRVVGDDIVPAPIGKVYSLLFGQESVTWMSNWLTDNQKSMDLQLEPRKPLTLESRTRTFTHIKPLGGSIGPKQTKCINVETLDNLDFEKAINLTVSTQTPDVPSGNVFSVKTKYCLSWAENNSTRVQVNCTIEWTGKSWLKSPIEKGATDGQTQHCKDLFASLKAAVAKPRAGPATNGGTLRPKKKGKKGKAVSSSPEDATKDVPSSKASKPNWGALEPVRQVLEPVTDLVQPLLTGNVMYGLLVGLLVASWFGFGFVPSKPAAGYGHHPAVFSADRLAAYEEMWRREESELWAWLEERTGLERLNTDGGRPRQKVMNPHTMEEKIREERMNYREIEEAIRVTEEKLRVLQDVVAMTPPASEASTS